MWVWPHFSQAATWPPSAAVRPGPRGVPVVHMRGTPPRPPGSMADITLSWPRLRWPARARRQAGPWARKTSATSNDPRGMAAPGQAGGTFRCSSGLLTARRVVLATWA